MRHRTLVGRRRPRWAEIRRRARSGEITITVNGERVVATAGTFASMPAGTPHSFRNESERPPRMLKTVALAGLEQMFFEVGVSLADGATAVPPSTPTRSSGRWLPPAVRHRDPGTATLSERLA
ncbi:MAG: cupin domain-containing protein [Gemmataceae bacterium]|nr:cupin domain-containing protein [Planctomycetia bacterium]MBX3401230.1 cupin domain-containing protein [Gemmataceae bacterium]